MVECPEPADRRWTALETELRAWRAAHPAATLTELEEAVDVRLQVARADLLGELATADAAPMVCCPQCGADLVRRGKRTRWVVTQGAQAIPLTRPYQTCPACGAGLFPPR